MMKLFEYLPEKLLRMRIKGWIDYRFHIKYFGLIDEAKQKGIRSIIEKQWLGFEDKNPEVIV